MHIAIVALGPSASEYFNVTEAHGSRHCFDRTYVINNWCGVLEADLVFHMDDVRIQEIRAQGGNQKIANMLEQFKQYTGTVLTSRSHPDYPCLLDYPLEDVINAMGSDYFINTVPYAIAYAGFKGATELSLFGVDYTYPGNNVKAELGKGCCEYWLGRLERAGVKVSVAKGSTLLAGHERAYYGYDTLNVKVDLIDGKAKVSMQTKPESELPTAEEIELRYNHGKPTT